MSTLKATNLQNAASGSVNITLNANGTSTFGGVVNFDAGQTFPNLVSSITAGTGLTGGTITTTGTIALDTTYTDGLYLSLAGGTMTGDITFSGTQTFPGVLDLAGGTMTGDIVFSGTQTFPAQNLQTVTDAGNSTTNAIDVAGLEVAGMFYPLSDGTANQVMTTDGAGNLGWLTTAEVVAVPGSSAAGGAVNQIAFGTGFFYFFDGTQWLQVAGNTF
jgi:hypothetical protein